MWRKSWTKLWGYIQIAVAGIVGFFQWAAPVTSDDTFKSYLSTVEAPKWIIAGFATLGLITWLAHGRDND